MTVRRGKIFVAIACASLLIGTAAFRWYERAETRVSVVEPKRILRGAWQRSEALARLIKREHVRTVITLTAINQDDSKYVAQSRVIHNMGVDWVLIPMRGSRATLQQMAEAADLVADPSRQPVFFHCVGGHHRSSLVQAAYRIRHLGWTADAAWSEVAALPWARPGSTADNSDRSLIEAFAKAYGRKDSHDEASMDSLGPARPGADAGSPRRVPPVAMGQR